MRVEDMVLVSVDDHLIEPEHLFEAHAPARYRDLAPQVVRDSGVDTWVFGDIRAHSVGREQATVGAVRTRAEDVDVQIRSRAEFRARDVATV
jgi:hypothetical protein